jgi:Zn-dependent peptidase ImmA (M78 family)
MWSTIAARVRQMLGVNHAVIFDYLELLENAGLRVVFCPMNDGVRSAAYYDPVNCNAFLVVCDGMNVERQLFELIKRLGAIYVHTRNLLCPPPVGSDADGAPSSSGEPVLDALHAARKFAALFLMPAQAVRASVAQLGIGPDQWTYELLLRLKHRFGVSAQSFVMRLKELRLIAPDAAGEIERRIEAHYARTNYGEPDSSRRILSPNGRLGDLLLAALDKPEARTEARAIEKLLRDVGVGWRGATVQRTEK